MMYPKNKPLKSKKLRDSARGEECAMQSPNCNGNSDTVVLCHSNKMEHGKGKGLKADDRHAFYGCASCHSWFDFDTKSSKEEKDAYYELAVELTHKRMREKGLGDILDS